ncbi:Protein of unknown function [Cotesia congregata]|uniref:Uncharacterized protein n=1 Tax=Cotesia congregata TaxID=51543 RepID=A0A8J2HPY1_COTCN|nr:Protein of unknown function [Cotesia congregata]
MYHHHHHHHHHHPPPPPPPSTKLVQSDDNNFHMDKIRLKKISQGSIKIADEYADALLLLVLKRWCLYMPRLSLTKAASSSYHQIIPCHLTGIIRMTITREIIRAT